MSYNLSIIPDIFFKAKCGKKRYSGKILLSFLFKNLFCYFSMSVSSFLSFSGWEDRLLLPGFLLELIGVLPGPQLSLGLVRMELYCQTEGCSPSIGLLVFGLGGVHPWLRCAFQDLPHWCLHIKIGGLELSRKNLEEEFFLYTNFSRFQFFWAAHLLAYCLDDSSSSFQNNFICSNLVLHLFQPDEVIIPRNESPHTFLLPTKGVSTSGL